MPAVAIKRAVHAYCPLVLKPTLASIEASEIGYRLAKGAFWSIAGAAISRSLTLVSSVFVVRMLGKTGYGELGMIQSTVGMFGVFAGFGLGLTATKFVAEFRRSDPGRAGRIIGLSGLVAIVTGGLMALDLFVFALFPVHPRTRAKIDAFGLNGTGFTMIDPVGHLEMLYAVRSAELVLTDSGGLQEETTVLGVPCITIRENTERPVTVCRTTVKTVPKSVIEKCTTQAGSYSPLGGVAQWLPGRYAWTSCC